MVEITNGPTWRKWITEGMPCKEMSCPHPMPSLLPRYHKVNSFSLPWHGPKLTEPANYGLKPLKLIS